MTKKKVKIFFCGPKSTWGISNFLTSYYFEILSKRLTPVLVSYHEADYFIVNETPQSQAQYFKIKGKKPNAISLLIAREALSPDFNLYDYAMGFDPINYEDRYLRFVPGYRYQKYLTIIPHTLIELKDRKFCDFIYSNRNAHSMRQELKNKIEKIGRVDSHGKYLNNVGKQRHMVDLTADWKQEKINLQSNYKFSIACENAFHYGYTSEKIFTSFAANSIPIYWGNPLIENDVNPERIINVHKFDSLQSLVEYISFINADDKTYKQIIREPWFTEKQNLEIKNYDKEWENFFHRIFSSPSPQRRGMGTYNEIYSKLNSSNYSQRYYLVFLKKLFSTRNGFISLISVFSNYFERRRRIK